MSIHFNPFPSLPFAALPGPRSVEIYANSSAALKARAYEHRENGRCRSRRVKRCEGEALVNSAVRELQEETDGNKMKEKREER